MSSSINPPNNQDDSTTERRRAAKPAGDGATADPSLATNSPGHDSVAGRREVVSRQKEQFGGMKFGSAFFGWLAATGMAVLLTALVAGIGAASGLGQSVDPAVTGVGGLPLAGIVGGIVLLAIVLIAYFCGGYVAGRMARFSGLKQGIAVWLWAIIVAIVVTIISVVAGTQSNVFANLGVPAVPVNRGTLTTAGILTAVGLAVVSLVGAILGGLAGMRYHRRVDIAGLGH